MQQERRGGCSCACSRSAGTAAPRASNATPRSQAVRTHTWAAGHPAAATSRPAASASGSATKLCSCERLLGGMAVQNRLGTVLWCTRGARAEAAGHGRGRGRARAAGWKCWVGCMCMDQASGGLQWCHAATLSCTSADAPRTRPLPHTPRSVLLLFLSIAPHLPAATQATPATPPRPDQRCSSRCAIARAHHRRALLCCSAPQRVVARPSTLYMAPMALAGALAFPAHHPPSARLPPSTASPLQAAHTPARLRACQAAVPPASELRSRCSTGCSARALHARPHAHAVLLQVRVSCPACCAASRPARLHVRAAADTASRPAGGAGGRELSPSLGELPVLELRSCRARAQPRSGQDACRCQCNVLARRSVIGRAEC